MEVNHLTDPQKEGIQKHDEERDLLCRKILEKESERKKALEEKRSQKLKRKKSKKI